MDKIDVEFRKTGRIVSFEGAMPNSNDSSEYMYVFGLKVDNIVYKCHYTTKENLDIDVGDYALINGRLYDLDFGFVSMGMVAVLFMTLIKMRNFEEFSKNHILIADFKIKGRELKDNQQNGFIINKNIERKRPQIKQYGIFYVTGFNERGVAQGSCLGMFDNQTSLLSACIDTANNYSSSDYDKIEIVDFKRQIHTPFVKFIQDMSGRG